MVGLPTPDTGDNSVAFINSPGSAGFSPAFGTVPYPENPAFGANHLEPVSVGQRGNWPEARAGLPPEPSYGGQPGVVRQLGWSTGFRRLGKLHNRMTGRTLVVPNMGAHPAVGPVGFSTRSQRLRNKVEALRTDYTPTAAQVQQSFVGPLNKGTI